LNCVDLISGREVSAERVLFSLLHATRLVQLPIGSIDAEQVRIYLLSHVTPILANDTISIFRVQSIIDKLRLFLTLKRLIRVGHTFQLEAEIFSSCLVHFTLVTLVHVGL
jgi:hypothetical protein